MDISTECRGFHVCQSDGRHDVFVCPNNTAFNQRYLVCDWPNNFDCQDSEEFFDVNAATFAKDATIPEPPQNIDHLMKPNMQPHLKNFLKESDNHELNDSLFFGKKRTNFSIASFVSTTEKVLDYLGDSLSEMAQTGNPFSRLIINPLSNHPSW